MSIDRATCLESSTESAIPESDLSRLDRFARFDRQNESELFDHPPRHPHAESTEDLAGVESPKVCAPGRGAIGLACEAAGSGVLAIGEDRQRQDIDCTLPDRSFDG